MINTKQDYDNYLKSDLKYYMDKKDGNIKKVYSRVTRDNVYRIKEFLIQLRKCEYCLNNSYIKTKKLTNIVYDVKYIINKRKLNQMQIELGIEIYENSFNKGLTIYHTGGTVVNPNSKIGENCKLHGNNCIGNTGSSGTECPVIGDGVSLGVGAKVLGKVFIGNNIKIAAGAIVIDSFYEEGALLAGVPAKIVKKKCNAEVDL